MMNAILPLTLLLLPFGGCDARRVPQKGLVAKPHVLDHVDEKQELLSPEVDKYVWVHHPILGVHKILIDLDVHTGGALQAEVEKRFGLSPTRQLLVNSDGVRLENDGAIVGGQHLRLYTWLEEDQELDVPSSLEELFVELMKETADHNTGADGEAAAATLAPMSVDDKAASDAQVRKLMMEEHGLLVHVTAAPEIAAKDDLDNLSTTQLPGGLYSLQGFSGLLLYNANGCDIHFAATEMNTLQTSFVTFNDIRYDQQAEWRRRYAEQWRVTGNMFGGPLPTDRLWWNRQTLQDSTPQSPEAFENYWCRLDMAKEEYAMWYTSVMTPTLAALPQEQQKEQKVLLKEAMMQLPQKLERSSCQESWFSPEPAASESQHGLRFSQEDLVAISKAAPGMESPFAASPRAVLDNVFFEKSIELPDQKAVKSRGGLINEVVVSCHSSKAFLGVAFERRSLDKIIEWPAAAKGYPKRVEVLNAYALNLQLWVEELRRVATELKKELSVMEVSDTKRMHQTSDMEVKDINADVRMFQKIPPSEVVPAGPSGEDWRKLVLAHLHP